MDRIKPIQRNRRIAREIALQALYEIDCTPHPIGAVMAARLEEYGDIDDDLRQFAYQLVNGVWDHRARLDKIIHEHAPEFPLAQMAIIDRNLLRIAICEFAVLGTTPVLVAINEAIELAKQFGAENTAKFINGVLGALVSKEDDLRKALGAG